MAELKAKTTANKPRNLNNAKSEYSDASMSPKPPSKRYGNDFLSSLRKVRQENEAMQEDFGLV